MTQAQRDDLTTLFGRIRRQLDVARLRAKHDGRHIDYNDLHAIREDVEILSIVVGVCIGREPQIGHDHPWHGSRAYDRTADRDLLSNGERDDPLGEKPAGH